MVLFAWTIRCLHCTIPPNGLLPEDRQPVAVTIYRTTFCPYCVQAARLFQRLGVPFVEVNLDHDRDLRDELSDRFNWQTMPMIVVNGQFVGGYNDVAALSRSGALARMLAEST